MAVAGYLPPIVAEVLAEVGKFKAEMGEAKEELTGFQAAQTKFAAAGKVALMGLGVAAAGVGFESVKLAMSFDQTMELIHTQAGASQAEVEQLKDSVLALAPAVGIGPEKLAEGLYHIESTGMRGQAALDTLTQAAKLAAIGVADLDDVTYAMSGVMSVGMKDVKSAADAISFMNATVGMGDMRMDKLTQAIGTGILPAFKSAGLGMTDFSASLATLADNSVPADEAATRLKMTVALMSAPTKAAADALQEIGISSTQLANDMRQPNGLLVAVDDLKTHLEKSGKTAVEQNQIIEHAFGGGRTSGAIMTLIEESDRLKSKYDQLGTAAGRAATTNAAWAEQQKQFSQQLHELVAWLQELGVKIGNWLIPKLQSAAVWVMANTDLLKKLAIIIGGPLVVAIAAYVVSMASAAVATIAATWEILLIIAAVMAVAYGIYELVTHWNTAWSWIKGIAGDVWGWIVSAWHHTIDALATAAKWVKTKVIDPVVGFFMHYMWPVIKAFLDAFVWLFNVAFGLIYTGGLAFVALWRIVWGFIADVAQGAYNHVLLPVARFIGDYVIHPIVVAVTILWQLWTLAWGKITAAVQWAYDHVLTPLGHVIQTVFLGPIGAAVKGLDTIWHDAWKSLGDALQWTYDHVLKPVLDSIIGVISDIQKALDKVAQLSPFGGDEHIVRGGAVNHYATGGTVPGRIGSPQLAVVHGGEEILSVDQIRAMGGASAMSRTGGGGGSFGGGGGGDIVLQARFVMPDGKAVRTESLRYARRAGIAPTDLYPAQTGRLVRS